jgi:hypothetical protein
MKTADFYQSTADALGVALYLYPDGSVTNARRIGIEPTATIGPHEHWRRTEDHGLGEQVRHA